MPRYILLPACLSTLVLASCASVPNIPLLKSEKKPVLAVLEPVAGSGVSGTLEVAAVADGVRIAGRITGVAPGSMHGLHIHERGDCSAPDSSPGGHFNPRGADHGDAAALVHHLGDLPNQGADAQGNMAVDVTVHQATLDSKLNDDVLGRSLVLRAGPDDYSTQPDGGGGAAIACGVILRKP
ncbi:MAG: superoxide dismutase family protein [Proteobacteria bacterium]|nr:superoxide dismutase family protein [Pseudomonadota bacterium]